jgi:hypothetical protein
MENCSTQVYSKPNQLLVLWTSGDKEVALRTALRYPRECRKNGWWDKVRLVVWGPSAQLLARDRELQEHVKALQALGVETYACKAIADEYGEASDLQDLGIEVILMGPPLTSMLKEGWISLTF